jgi:hypothetical protein
MFMILVVAAGLAMNTFEVRSAPAQESLIPLDTSFTYQGFLENGESPIDGNCDFRFTLYNAATGGSTVGSLNQATLAVDRGVFATKLDFGNVFSMQRRWLSVAVRCPAGSGSYTTLTPRTEITSTPLSNALPNLSIDPSSGHIGINRNSYPFAYWLDVNGDIRSTTSVVATTSSGGIRATLGSNYYGGLVTARTGSGVTRSSLALNTAGAGYVNTIGPNGSENVRLTSYSSDINNGYISVHDSSGVDRASMFILLSDAGIMKTRGPNGNDNFIASTLNNYPNNGYASVQDSSGTTQAGMYVNSSGQGVIFGDTKSFRTTNPFDTDTEIWYASLEGPEAAAYIRGTTQLVDGKATITLPEHFLAVASEPGMTVQLTPLSADSLGLAVVEKSLRGIVVQELHGGTGSYEFDFMVTAVRLGYEDFQVIRPVDEVSPTMLDEAGGIGGDE